MEHRTPSARAAALLRRLVPERDWVTLKAPEHPNTDRYSAFDMESWAYYDYPRPIVRGSDGLWYWIGKGLDGNVYQCSTPHGNVLGRYCTHTRGNMVEADHHIAVILAAQADAYCLMTEANPYVIFDGKAWYEYRRKQDLHLATHPKHRGRFYREDWRFV